MKGLVEKILKGRKNYVPDLYSYDSREDRRKKYFEAKKKRMEKRRKEKRKQ
jgi:hypothetical protein